MSIGVGKKPVSNFYWIYSIDILLLWVNSAGRGLRDTEHSFKFVSHRRSMWECPYGWNQSGELLRRWTFQAFPSLWPAEWNQTIHLNQLADWMWERVAELNAWKAIFLSEFWYNISLLHCPNWTIVLVKQLFVWCILYVIVSLNSSMTLGKGIEIRWSFTVGDIAPKRPYGGHWEVLHPGLCYNQHKTERDRVEWTGNNYSN